MERGPQQINSAKKECNVKSDAKLRVERGTQQIKRAQN